MEQLNRNNEAAESIVEETAEKPRRQRSMTTLKLQWVAERLRKCRDIKNAIDQGVYSVDSRDVAKSLIQWAVPAVPEEGE